MKSYLTESVFRNAGIQPELIPHGDVSDRLLNTHSGCKFLLISLKSVQVLPAQSQPCPVLSVVQDGILFGMVGAYDWDGGVLKEGFGKRIMPPREAFESEFPLEFKKHAAYLGTHFNTAKHNRKRLVFVVFA